MLGSSPLEWGLSPFNPVKPSMDLLDVCLGGIEQLLQKINLHHIQILRQQWFSGDQFHLSYESHALVACDALNLEDLLIEKNSGMGGNFENLLPLHLLLHLNLHLHIFSAQRPCVIFPSHQSGKISVQLLENLF